MDLDGNALLLSLAMSSLGLGLFVYGKRQSRFPQMLAGVTMMVYPYFVSNLLVMAAIGAALIVALWVAVRLGA
ncbi:MAG: hypothetical protein JOZ69_22555 [Myxococcales bacterium]|nr:hypothetical protein [Myxococcales bacterium]